jgi:hypothetical protein
MHSIAAAIMRIGDTVKLSANPINGNELFLYTQKTGVPVNCILPDSVLMELEQTARSSEGHFFWTGKSKLHSAIGKCSADFKDWLPWQGSTRVMRTAFVTPSP